MAVNPNVTVTEKFPSRRNGYGEQTRVELYFIVSGTSSEIDARDSLLANSAVPATYNAGTIAGLSSGPGSSSANPLILQLRQVDLEEPMPGSWFATCSYGLFIVKRFPLTGEAYYNFDTGGGTQHIDYGLSTSGTYPASGQTADDFKSAINVSGDGASATIGGLDITVPVFNWSETWYIANTAITAAYKMALYTATGKMNLNAWRGFNAGECLFLGASGSQRGRDDFEVTFKYASSPNVSSLSICGGAITVATKNGWDYMWVRSKPQVVGGIPILQPVAAYVVKVYQSIDFLTFDPASLAGVQAPAVWSTGAVQ
jgi:hypothetical protein